MDTSIYDFENKLQSSQLVEYSKEPIMYDFRKISNPHRRKLFRFLREEKYIHLYPYIWIYDWVTLLYSRNWHHTVNQLYFNTKIIRGKKSEMRPGSKMARAEKV